MRRFDVAELQAALAATPDEWSLPSTYAETNAHHGYRRIVLVSAGNRTPAATPWAAILDAFDPIREAWLSSIDAGGFIVPHRDGAPWFERWQVPIRTAGTFDDIAATDGVPFRVTHSQPHAVWNDGDTARVHIVIDRDIRLDLPAEPFAAFPVPADRADFVARVAGQTE